MRVKAASFSQGRLSSKPANLRGERHRRYRYCAAGPQAGSGRFSGDGNFASFSGGKRVSGQV